jgi:hypothetical protein
MVRRMRHTMRRRLIGRYGKHKYGTGMYGRVTAFRNK